MDDKLLLQSLVNQRLIAQDDAEGLLADAVTLKKDAETLINERHLVDDSAIAKIKSEILKIPIKRFKPEEITEELLKMIPENTARTYKVIPLERRANLFVIGMVHPDDANAADALRYIAKREQLSLGVYLITQSDFDAAMRRYAPVASEIDQAIKNIRTQKGAGESERVVALEGSATIAEEAPVIKIVASFLKDAVDRKASDIHIEPERSRLRVRFRIDGELQEQTSLPATLHQPIISRVKVLANLKIDENRIPQDGRFRTEVFGRFIDFRVATFPTPLGEKVAIRVLDSSIGLKDLSTLGLVGKNEALVREAIQKPYGMVLVTGPTGSGKTTTLYALLQLLNKEEVNIVSLEDPVEYFIEGVNQSQVRPEIGYDFASGLRQILRQDPDVIMVGEIRDIETAQLAVHAALTGHIVFSTLHTNNVIAVIPRLIDMKVDAFLLPSALNLMVGQRLVSRLCQKCKESSHATEAVVTIIKKELENLASSGIKEAHEFKAPYTVYRAKGCDACGGKGIVGRIGLFEVLTMSQELGELLGSGISENKIITEARRQGMVTMRQDGVLKALQGLVTIEEVLRETEE